ncbi:MAG: NAD(+) synthase [Acidobacteriota bacterium]|nr:NAD(+) synthase [Blastocatellia bacterium]MDW8413327.1 NAD(+) synthase [Acidobacteriota bacterium]
MYGFVRVAAAVPRVRVADVGYNVSQILELCRQAGDEGVQILAFPELCITGYTCADLFHQKQLQHVALDGLKELLAATSALPMLIIVGLPVAVDSQLFNCAAVLFRGRLLGIVPKTRLPGYKEFYEPRWFAPARRAISKEVLLFGERVPFGNDLLFRDLNNRQLIVGVEICEDLWMPIPPSSHMVLDGATVIVNLSASNELVGKADYRRQLVLQQSGRCICTYVYSSCGVHESTTDVVFSGHAMIAENSSMLAESALFRRDNYFIVVDSDVERLVREREVTNSFGECIPDDRASYRFVDYEGVGLDLNKRRLCRYVDPHPFVPSDISTRNERCRTIFAIQAAGLAKRLEHLQQMAGLKEVVIGISGGLDSTLALFVTVKAFDMLGMNRKQIVAITMPGFGTTGRTRSNAIVLCEALGVTIREISITESVLRHFADIGHDPEVKNVTYENAQARMRTMILMDLGFVIGTGDLSELALGWCTYNGDHMSMYGVNAGVPKTLVRHLVRWVADVEADEQTRRILQDILDTPISPELLPPDEEGRIAQKTEQIVGPYELTDFFTFHALRNGYTADKILFLAEQAFADKYSKDELVKWLRSFYVKFFSQQFKRSCLPDGPKVGSVSLSPRGDLRMPSDGLPNAWINCLDQTYRKL